MKLRNNNTKMGMQVARRVTKAIIASTDQEDIAGFV
jgi:hypothetical protein